MANLIITVIAIALVAVAALMGAYYGGSAFLNNQMAAEVDTVIGQGGQIQGGWDLYDSSNNAIPASWDALVAGGDLSQVPQFPAAPGGIAAGPWSIAADDNNVYWAHASLGTPTASPTNPCLKALMDAGVRNPVVNTGNWSSATMTSPANGNGTFGCYYFNGSTIGGPDLPGGGNGVPGGQYLFFYRLQ